MNVRLWCQYSVVRIVREKMMRTDAYKDPEELRAFLSQLYVYLVDEMHVALNKVLLCKNHIRQHCESCSSKSHSALWIMFIWITFYSLSHVSLNQTLSVDSQDKHHDPRLSCSQLKLLAKEGELNKDYQQAAQCYQEVNSHIYLVLLLLIMFRWSLIWFL